MLEPDILIDNVTSLAESRPGSVFARLIFPDVNPINITYQTLLQRASRYATLFRERGIKKNDVVVIILEETEQLLYAFVGALLWGAIPSIFAHPSIKISAPEYSRTLDLLLNVCNTRFLLTDKSLVGQLGKTLNPLDNKTITVLVTEDALPYPGLLEKASCHASDIVLLQHSSGTTGLKKGVALSNRNVMNQLRNYATSIRLCDEDKIVSWLPLYHDMGLIACFILPLASGVPLVLMSPFHWIANPIMLLRAIHDNHCTLCWMPNFAYNFLATRIGGDKTQDLDLSSMRAFINCAESVSAHSHQLFYDRFRQNGLRPTALCTSYAMAENTFAVTQGGITEPVKVETLDADALLMQQRAVLASSQTKAPQLVVSSGKPIPNNEIQIVDEEGKALPERRVGEIVIRSDSMLSGYYRRPDLAQQAVKNGWYWTGDLGYVAGGDLFVLGRKKDMIIVAGKNIYPQDIEEIVSGIEGVYPGRAVAFGVYNDAIGTEDVIILAESVVEDKPKKLALKLAIAKAIREQLECIANEIILLPHMWLLKSSSGKISRSGNRKKYLRELRAK